MQASGIVGGSGEAANRPVHLISIAVMGMPLVDNGYFEDAAREAAARKQWEFFTTVQLTALSGGTATISMRWGFFSGSSEYQLAAAGFAIFDDLICDGAHDAYRNGKSHPRIGVACAEEGGVDADQLAPQIDQGSA